MFYIPDSSLDYNTFILIYKYNYILYLLQINILYIKLYNIKHNA